MWTVAALVPREFALLMQAAQPIVVDPRSPGGSGQSEAPRPRDLTERKPSEKKESDGQV
jgi:hypothetical protein